MKFAKITFLLLLFSVIAQAQNNPLSIFEPLMGKTWNAVGKWGDGSSFKQTVTFEYGLNKGIVIARSDGYTNEERTTYGERNFGIRQFDQSKNEIAFSEYDVFGGLTKGKVYSNGQDIFYEYAYGESVVTDLWQYVNDSTYNYQVGSYDGENWQQVYLKTKFEARNDISLPVKYLSMLKNTLPGSWKSKAWNGELEETWRIRGDGSLVQEAEYAENGKVLYASTSKIEQVGKDLILFSVIKDNNPKIFKATAYGDNYVLFENSEYKNPSKVKYIVKNDGSYNRLISGIENGEAVEYIFEFSKN